MKILITLNSSNYGGIERTVLDLVKGLSKNNEVLVVCPNGDYLEEYKKFAKIFIYKKVTKIDLSYIFFLKKILKKEEVDVLHSNDPRITFNSLIAGYLAKTKVMISHTHTPISSWQIPEFSKKLNIFMNSLIVNLLSDYEICLTEVIRKQKEAEGINPDKLFVISNCLDEDFKEEVFNLKSKEFFPNKNFEFLCISRFSIEKNQQLLVEAFYEFSKLYKNVNLTLVGKGPLQVELKQLARSLKIEDRIEFINEIDDKEKVVLMAKANCFVFPTLAEGFGLVLIEAMTTCKYVIASDLEVLKEVSNNQLIYFKSNDKLDLLKKMLEVYEGQIPSNYEENKSLVFSKYSFENYIKSYEKIYSSKL